MLLALSQALQLTDIFIVLLVASPKLLQSSLTVVSFFQSAGFRSLVAVSRNINVSMTSQAKWGSLSMSVIFAALLVAPPLAFSKHCCFFAALLVAR